MEPSTPEITGGSTEDRDRARNAWTLGLIAIMVIVLDGCIGPVALLLSLSLGWLAMTRARGILAEQPDGITEVYARTAQITGVASVVVSGMWLILWCLLLTTYLSVFAAVMSPIASSIVVSP